MEEILGDESRFMNVTLFLGFGCLQRQILFLCLTTRLEHSCTETINLLRGMGWQSRKWIDMPTEIVFLRHAETLVDPDSPASEWHLAPSGRSESYELAASGILGEVDAIVSSDEMKAIETAEPFAKMFGLEINRNHSFRELNRNTGPFLTREEYLSCVQEVLRNPSARPNGWECATDALSRTKRAVQQTMSQYGSKRVLVVSHGLVLTLYFADLQATMHEAFDRWTQLPFCGWGVVSNNRVLRDIARSVY